MPVQPDAQDSTVKSPSTGDAPTLTIVSAAKLPPPTRVHVRHEIASTVSCGHASYQTVVDAVLATLTADPTNQASLEDQRTTLNDEIRHLKYAARNGATLVSREHAELDLEVKRSELDELERNWLRKTATSIVDELIAKGLLEVSRDAVHPCSELFAVAS